MKQRVFSRTYWKTAAAELKRPRQLVLAALVCALSVVTGAFYIPVGENLRVYFTFLLTAAGCAAYGPVTGMLAAAVTDTLNFILFPSGPYFPGYMLGEMLTALIYGLFLYRRKITVLRLLTARFLVNGFINVLLGCLWSRILTGKGYLYFLASSAVKNSLLLPLETLALVILFSCLKPALSRLK